MKSRARSKQINIFNGNPTHVYTMNISALVHTDHLVIQGVGIPETGSSKDMNYISLIQDPKSQEPSLGEIPYPSLAFKNVKLRGNLYVDCSSVHLELTLHAVRFEDGNIKVVACNHLRLHISKSHLRNVKCHFESAEGSYISVTNTKLSDQHSAMLFAFTSGAEPHVVTISNSSFVKSGRSPKGALAIGATRANSAVKASLRNCTFLDNGRALDLAVAGDLILNMNHCKFHRNIAYGAGGAMRVIGTELNPMATERTTHSRIIVVHDSVFTSNVAKTETVFDNVKPPVKRSLSNSLRSNQELGSGGALYLKLRDRAAFGSTGLLTITASNFDNNTADDGGSALFICPGMAAEVKNCTFKGPASISQHVSDNGLISVGGMISLENVDITGSSSSGISTPLLSYHANDPLNENIKGSFLLTCPPGYNIKKNSKIGHSGAGHSSLDVVCLPCPPASYSLGVASLLVGATQNLSSGSHLECNPCPYGAVCDKGIKSKSNFWGAESREAVVMYSCPFGYCSSGSHLSTSYDTCAENRVGILCGKCVKDYSEAIGSTHCLPNSQCGRKKYLLITFFIVTSLLYVLFFMFQHELSWFFYYVFRRCKRSPACSLDQYSSDPGYFQIFMFFIQAIHIINLPILADEEQSFAKTFRPGHLIPSYVLNGVTNIVNFNVLGFLTDSCIFPNINPVH